MAIIEYFIIHAVYLIRKLSMEGVRPTYIAVAMWPSHTCCSIFGTVANFCSMLSHVN